MPSPFPGMDPYLEAHWRDVHAALIIYSRDAIQGKLPAPLRARVEERVMLESPEENGDADFYPDLRVIRHSAIRGRGTAALAVEPEADSGILVPREVPPERFLQIIDPATGNRVVTIVEFLSPTNKRPGPGRKSYLSKQKETLTSDTSLVEIDLTRSGESATFVRPDELSADSRATYWACISRAWERGVATVHPIPLDRPLPRIAVPLRRKDKNVTLDLQALVEQCYHNGGYDGTIDYRDDPDPPLTRREAEWVEELLREKGLRKRRATRRKKS